MTAGRANRRRWQRGGFSQMHEVAAVWITPKALTLLEHCTAFAARPNVRAKATAEADAAWPRKDNLHQGLERPSGGCRSGSPP
jgi:hypothetical protein